MSVRFKDFDENAERERPRKLSDEDLIHEGREGNETLPRSVGMTCEQLAQQFYAIYHRFSFRREPLGQKASAR
jgi:hypothetical protein